VSGQTGIHESMLITTASECTLRRPHILGPNHGWTRFVSMSARGDQS
jgi:hypothetical protein